MQDEVEASASTSEPSEAFAQAWRNTRQEQVREALNTLPHEQLQILELSYFSGYTHAEIAERLELPLGTVKGRMRLGLQKLRDYVGMTAGSTLFLRTRCIRSGRRVRA